MGADYTGGWVFVNWPVAYFARANGGIGHPSAIVATQTLCGAENLSRQTKR
ncbi:hypothetical protein [Mesorhizobium sp. M2C.T.Ca.TU.002.02.1.1]|uniref:hypothetical protein n=1 Tax=Mesorhizobium sp. M2C.T.Ca.TU.002.02.1.1 TaxID=2496788 RepID=UPI0013E30BB8|nr:hypothetical protein [Mesorhizobium sp. M2C.T.Ca.TU.002.02.1.1]